MKTIDKAIWKLKKELDRNEDIKCKLVYLGNCKWVNAITGKEETIENLYILGFESSNRPIIVTQLTINDTIEKTIQIYKYFEHLSHTNLSYGIEEQNFRLNGKDIRIEGQSFCNPITAYQVLEEDENDIRGLIKANLLSQNFDDSFSSINSVINNEIDKPVGNLTRESSMMSLLLKGCDLQDTSTIIPVISKIKKIDDKYIYAKKKIDNFYSYVSKQEYRQNRKLYSDYYPIFNKEYIDKQEIEIPDEEYEIGVYGLGSAGTAILDQLCRANYVRNIYLCDFDTVEEKNLNNQWYSRSDLSLDKTYATYKKINDLTKLDGRQFHQFYVKYDNKKFQDTNLQSKKFKYLVSGFDSIKTRLEFLEKIEKGELRTDYLIDCRYLDLSSSIYLIDTKNKEEMAFYRANLEEDEKLFQKQKLSFEEFCKIFNYDNCSRFREEYKLKINCTGINCDSEECKRAVYESYIKSGVTIKKENTCLKQNYIDIYKYVGAIVFGAFRKLQNKSKKPFSLIEAQTDVNGLPNYMIVKE